MLLSIRRGATQSPTRSIVNPGEQLRRTASVIEVLARAAADDGDDRIEPSIACSATGDQKIAAESLRAGATEDQATDNTPGSIAFSARPLRMTMPLIAARR